MADNKANLDCSLKVLEHVIDVTTTQRRLDDLGVVLREAAAGFGAVWDSRDVEPDGSVWLRVGLVANTANPAPQYVPPKEIPAAAKVPPCTSDVTGPSRDCGD